MDDELYQRDYQKILSIHGYHSSSEESDEGSKLDFDEELEANKPSPIVVDPLRHNIVTFYPGRKLPTERLVSVDALKSTPSDESNLLTTDDNQNENNMNEAAVKLNNNESIEPGISSATCESKKDAQIATKSKKRTKRRKKNKISSDSLKSCESSNVHEKDTLTTHRQEENMVNVAPTPPSHESWMKLLQQEMLVPHPDMGNPHFENYRKYCMKLVESLDVVHFYVVAHNNSNNVLCLVKLIYEMLKNMKLENSCQIRCIFCILVNTACSFEYFVKASHCSLDFWSEIDGIILYMVQSCGHDNTIPEDGQTMPSRVYVIIKTILYRFLNELSRFFALKTNIPVASLFYMHTTQLFDLVNLAKKIQRCKKLEKTKFKNRANSIQEKSESQFEEWLIFRNYSRDTTEIMKFIDWRTSRRNHRVTDTYIELVLKDPKYFSDARFFTRAFETVIFRRNEVLGVPLEKIDDVNAVYGGVSSVDPTDLQHRSNPCLGHCHHLCSNSYQNDQTASNSNDTSNNNDSSKEDIGVMRFYELSEIDPIRRAAIEKNISDCEAYFERCEQAKNQVLNKKFNSDSEINYLTECSKNGLAASSQATQNFKPLEVCSDSSLFRDSVPTEHVLEKRTDSTVVKTNVWNVSLTNPAIIDDLTNNRKYFYDNCFGQSSSKDWQDFQNIYLNCEISDQKVSEEDTCNKEIISASLSELNVDATQIPILWLQQPQNLFIALFLFMVLSFLKQLMVSLLQCLLWGLHNNVIEISLSVLILLYFVIFLIIKS